MVRKLVCRQTSGVDVQTIRGDKDGCSHCGGRSRFRLAATLAAAVAVVVTDGGSKCKCECQRRRQQQAAFSVRRRVGWRAGRAGGRGVGQVSCARKGTNFQGKDPRGSERRQPARGRGELDLDLDLDLDLGARAYDRQDWGRGLAQLLKKIQETD